MKKKIIFCAYNLDVGGIETSLVNLLKNMDKNKYDITLLLEKKEGIFLDQVPSYIRIIDYNICESKNILKRKIINRTKLIITKIKYYHKFDASICYATHRRVCSILASTMSKNSIIWVHGEYWFTKEEGYKIINDFHLANYQKIVFVSNKSKDKYLELVSNNNSKLYVLNNIVDYENVIEQSKKEIIKKNKIVLLNISRHEEKYKQLFVLLKSVNRLIKKKYDFELWMVGDGPEHQKYLDYVKEEHLEKNIKFLGRKKNPFIYYEACDAVVLSSIAEGNPVVYLEAKVLNKPIITTDVSDARKDINGFGIITNNNPEDYYQGLKQFLDEGYIIKDKFEPVKYNQSILKDIDIIIEE